MFSFLKNCKVEDICIAALSLDYSFSSSSGQKHRGLPIRIIDLSIEDR